MRRSALLMALALVLAIGMVPIAGATSSLSIGAPSYDSPVIKDSSFTVTAIVTASGVSSTITVTATLQDNTGGAVTIQSAEQVKTYTSNTSQTFTWTVTANTPGTYSGPLKVTASASDGGSATPVTGTTTLTVKDRPTISLTLSPDRTTVSAGDTVRLDYTITNGGGGGAADATGVSAALTLPDGWSRTGGGANPYSTGTISPGEIKAGYWILKASSSGSTNTLTVTVTSTVPGGTVVDSCTITGSTTSTTSSPGGGGTYPPATPTTTATAATTAAHQPTALDGTAPTPKAKVTPAEPAVSEKATPISTVKTATEKPKKKGLPGFAGVSAIAGLLAALYLVRRRM